MKYPKEVQVDLKILSDMYPEYVFYAIRRDIKLVDFLSKK